MNKNMYEQGFKAGIRWITNGVVYA